MTERAASAATVFVVDDDDAVRDALALLLRTAGLDAHCYSSAQAFLDAYQPEQAGCLLLDIRMPGMDGMELQAQLRRRGDPLPIIFITGHGDVPLAVQAMRRGAVEFLQKPFADEELLGRIREALALDAARRSEAAERAAVRARRERLTPREREVLDLMVDGKSTKEIAFELGVSPRTAEVHRGRVMEKMQARSLADLVHAVLRSD